MTPDELVDAHASAQESGCSRVQAFSLRARAQSVEVSDAARNGDRVGSAACRCADAPSPCRRAKRSSRGLSGFHRGDHLGLHWGAPPRRGPRQ